MNPLRSLANPKQFQNSEENRIDLKTLDLEFEFRTSDLVNKLCLGQLSTCVCHINFDEDNILDLQNSGEIEHEALLAMEVVSEDRQALKTRIKRRELARLMKKTIPQRLFKAEDVVQIQILN